MFLIVCAIMSMNIALTVFMSSRSTTKEGASSTFSRFMDTFPNDTPDPKKQVTGPKEQDTRPIVDVCIAPHGDLILKLSTSEKIVRFRVASQVLCLSSPVFSAMLGPSSDFKEANELRAHPRGAREPYVVSIEDDSSIEFRVILNAIHHRNSLVPLVTANREALWCMAVICDKYDFTEAVSAWVGIWAQEWRKRVICDPDHGHWLFIAWTFGLADIFTVVSKDIILRGYYGAEGFFMSGGGERLDDLGIPERVMG